MELVENCLSRLEIALRGIDTDGLADRIGETEARLASGDAWRDPERMTALLKRRDLLEGHRRALAARGEARVLAALLADPDCTPVDRDALEADLEALVAQAEGATMSEEDRGDAVVLVRPGTGGDDAARFTALMARRIVARAARMGLACEEVEAEPWGEGLRSVTFHLRGPGAFGRMKDEAGKQRLVHVPSTSALRQTSFCMVEVLPLRPPREALVIPESEIRTETFRATGPGGQHRNTTDSAVRVTHLPTGITATSVFKSQHVNRQMAMATLSARLEARLRAEDEAQDRERRAQAGPAGFGGHVRSIVLHPYRLVRDERTGASTAGVEEWLGGGDLQA